MLLQDAGAEGADAPAREAEELQPDAPADPLPWEELPLAMTAQEFAQRLMASEASEPAQLPLPSPPAHNASQQLDDAAPALAQGAITCTTAPPESAVASTAASAGQTADIQAVPEGVFSPTPSSPTIMVCVNLQPLAVSVHIWEVPKFQVVTGGGRH